MGPFDWLKDKIGQGIGDIGHAIATGVQDIENNFNGGNQATPVRPATSQTGTSTPINVAPAQTQPNAIKISQPQQQQPNPVAIDNTNPAPSSAQTGQQSGPTPVVSGVHTESDINQSLNNPIIKINRGNPAGVTPNISEVITNQQGGTPIKTATPNSGNGLIQLAQNQNNNVKVVNAPSTPAPAPQNKPQPPQENILQKGADLGKGALGLVTNTFKGTIVDPAEAEIADIRGDKAAEAKANAQTYTDLQQSLPGAIAMPILNAAKETAGAIVSPYANEQAQKSADYARKIMNDHTGDPVHDSAVDAYASNLQENMINDYLHQYAGVDMNTSKGETALHVASPFVQSAMTAVGGYTAGLTDSAAGWLASRGLPQALSKVGGAIATGAPVGYGFDVGSNMGDPNKHGAQLFEPGAGTALSIAFPVAGSAAAAGLRGGVDIASNLASYINDLYQQSPYSSQAGFVRVPWLEPGEREIEPLAQSYAAENTSQQIAQDHADLLESLDKGARGGIMIEDNSGSGAPTYTRTSEHSNFYRQYYADNGRAPSKQAYLDEALRQLNAGSGDMLDPGVVDAFQLAKAREQEATTLPNAEQNPMNPIEGQSEQSSINRTEGISPKTAESAQISQKIGDGSAALLSPRIQSEQTQAPLLSTPGKHPYPVANSLESRLASANSEILSTEPSTPKLADQATPHESTQEQLSNQPSQTLPEQGGRTQKASSQSYPDNTQNAETVNGGSYERPQSVGQILHDSTRGLVLKQSKPTVDGGFYQTMEMVKDPQSGQFYRTIVDHINGVRYPRDINGYSTVPSMADRIKVYAHTFGITINQAEKDFAEMAKPVERNTPKYIEKFGNDKPLTIAQRRRIIAENPEAQGTANKVDLSVEGGNTRGAISKALYVTAERDRRLENAIKETAKLSANDQHLFYEWEDGANIEDLLQRADNPRQLQTAITTGEDAFDYALAADRAAGGSTLRQPRYGLPKIYEATEEEMNKMGIPENERYKYHDYAGFRSTSAKYKSYLEAEREAGLKPLYKTPAEAMEVYKNEGSNRLLENGLFTTLSRSNPLDIAGLDVRGDSSGRRFTQAAGRLGFSASDELQPRLRGFSQPFASDNALFNTAAKAATRGNAFAKQLLFFGTPFHYMNGLRSFLGTAFGALRPDIAVRGMAEAFGSSLVPTVYRRIEESARADGTLEFIRENGGEIRDTTPVPIRGEGKSIPIRNALNKYGPRALMDRNMAAFFNTFMINFGRAVKNAGVETGSAEASAIFSELNKTLGHFNAQIEGGSPTIARVTSAGALAPQWTRTQLAVVKDALMKSIPVMGTAKRGFGITNPGDIARANVLGSRLTEMAFATIVTALITGKMPTLHSLIARGGFMSNNPVPNIDANQKNQKGESQLIELPTDPIGLSVGLVTDPAHFLQSRFSPALSTATRIVTNTDWNGNPLVDKNQPGWQKQLVIKSLGGDLPIGLQNFTNPNLTVGQGIVQEFGGRIKTNPEDKQVQATNNYFNSATQFQNDLQSGHLSAIDPSLKNVSPDEGQYWLNQYLGLHPINTKDLITGLSIPRDWNALSNEQKASYYLANNQQTGQQQLSPIFYIDKSLAAQDPSRPHEPMFDLTGNGVGVDGNPAPKAQIAIEYTNLTTGDPQRSIMLAANPWLSKYETDVANYAQGYQANMTSYMKNQGWSDQAIQQYWQQHPSNTPPVQPPTFDQNTQNIMNEYQAITDPTARSQFFAQNADVLSNAFDQEAQYVNIKRLASGNLALQGYPTESDHVKSVLSSMPTGTDSASKKARALLINNNPDVNQYLADVALYDATKNLSQYEYQNPQHPGFTEGQLLNLGDQTAQKTLKDISSLGAYDIGKNPAGVYSFMQNGGFGPGVTVGNGKGSGSKRTYRPYVSNPRKPRQRHIKIEKPHLVHPHYVKVKHSKPTFAMPIKIQHGNQFKPSHGVRIA